MLACDWQSSVAPTRLAARIPPGTPPARLTDPEAQIQVATSLTQIKVQILSEYDVEDQRCESDLRQLLTELEASGLIEFISA